jgi:hypothetical protein
LNTTLVNPGAAVNSGVTVRQQQQQQGEDKLGFLIRQ